MLMTTEKFIQNFDQFQSFLVKLNATESFAPKEINGRGALLLLFSIHKVSSEELW